MQRRLHPYAIFDHKRQTIGRYLGVAAFILGPLLSQFFVSLSSLTGLSFLGTFIVSSGIIYLGLDWIFDNVLWKVGLVGKLLSIPNYSGKWAVKGQTIGEYGEVQFNWDGVVTIVQKWDNISIQLKTDNSQSYSYTASTLKLPDDSWQLSYSYSNQPNLEQVHDLKSHNGFSELVFDLENGSAVGTYFNSNGRRTSGNMSLTIIKELENEL